MGVGKKDRGRIRTQERKTKAFVDIRGHLFGTQLVLDFPKPISGTIHFLRIELVFLSPVPF